jgi:antitoxin HicB
MQSRDLRYWMAQDYRLEVQRMRDDVEPYWYVTSPDLDELMCYGTGETIDEAVRAFHESKEAAFEFYLEKGVPIPEPLPRSPLTASGKFIVRVPKWVHARIASEAKEQGVSLNSWVNTILLANLMRQDAIAESGKDAEVQCRKADGGKESTRGDWDDEGRSTHLQITDITGIRYANANVE